MMGRGGRQFHPLTFSDDLVDHIWNIFKGKTNVG